MAERKPSPRAVSRLFAAGNPCRVVRVHNGDITDIGFAGHDLSRAAFEISDVPFFFPNLVYCGIAGTRLHLVFLPGAKPDEHAKATA